ncbi:hypothetical protein AW736_00855 [Termitidicoccus mucosus]|uniref:Ig-like domain-containing protein n=2 Tax=Termitidicoccus mucosus TaxID=1184151 RepID=A0A178IM90_9BACT|nr:hypothetical protein AW736_00855 [Opitutaceae bacterium TSB47]
MDNINNIYNLSSSSQFTGGFSLEEGRLNINNPGALGTGQFRISEGTAIDNTSGSALAVSNTLNPSIALYGDFTFLGSNNLNLGTGQVTLTGPVRTITVLAGRLEFGGPINGEGIGLTQAGAGTLVLSGNSASHTGAIAVANGAVMANGSIAQSTVTVSNSSALGGFGTVGMVAMDAGSTLRPGDLALIVTDTAMMASGTFTGTIGAGYSTLTIDKSVSNAGEILHFASGAEMEFALGKGRTNTKIAIINSGSAATPTVAFDNNAIKIHDLAAGAAEPGDYVLFATGGLFDTDFSGLTVDPDGNITAGLAVVNESAYIQPGFGYKLKKTAAGIVFRLYHAPVITGDDPTIAVNGWNYQNNITISGEFDTSGVTGLPAGLSYNPATHAISGVPNDAAAIYTATITASNAATTATKIITIELRDAVPAPVFTSNPIVAAPLAPFSYTVTADNLPQSLAVVGGLPAWLALTQDPITGVWTISGTPTEEGAWTIVLEATNPSGTTQFTLTIIIADSTAAPVITSATSMVWVVNYPLNYQIIATGSPAFYNVSGTLPAGVALDSFTGAIAGTPTAAGISTVTMHAINSTGTGSAALGIEVLTSMDQPRITSSSTATGLLNQAFSYTVTAAPYINSIAVTGMLPSWLTYDAATATLSGTCEGDAATWSASGSTWPVVVEASNVVGTVTGTINVLIKKAYPIPTLTNSGTDTCYVGRSYSYQITVSSTEGVESYSANGLPTGLDVDQLTGEISGVPTSTGTYTIDLGATSSGGTGTGQYVLNVVAVPPGPFITSPAAADGASGQPFSYQITAETPVTTYGATGLPPGLSLDPATGLVSGTPTVGGYYLVEISTTDASGTFVATVAISLVPANSTLVTYAGEMQSPGFIDASGTDARFDQPSSAAIDVSGIIYVADFANNAIRAIAADGVVSSYISNATSPAAMTADSRGNIYYADQQTNTIRKILPLDKTVWTVANGLLAPGGIAVDASDNIYITDSGNNVIKKISATDGTVSVVAGNGAVGSADGVGTAAQFNLPQGLVCDKSANILYVADMLNSTLRAVNLFTRTVTTLAGQAGEDGYWDGVGSVARFRTPQGLAIDAAGFVYVADTGNSTIRVCDPKTGLVATLIGIPRQAGAIDGSGATALMNLPAGITADTTGTGDIYVIDSGNSAIRALLFPPSIATPLASGTIKAGRPITLDGSAWGAPAPVYQWYKEGVKLTGSQSKTLVLDSAKASDAGSYQVMAFNASGTASSSMQLAVDTSSGGGGTIIIDGDGGGGGGAPGFWFLLGIGALALCRRIFSRANKH